MSNNNKHQPVYGTPDTTNTNINTTASYCLTFSLHHIQSSTATKLLIVSIDYKLHVACLYADLLRPVHSGDKVEFEIRQSPLCRLSPCTHWRKKIGKDVQHSGDKNHPLSTKSTELNIEHVQLWR